ncbi:hypothetical protein [Aquimarina sp. I32.4]|uniref:hypothetical protein n=1 Tax=Aquimarina sp. I32.4 TaxID=2053903 RepID=UPI001304EBB1|nr:hypothetical protein [Aquimarina sp. I32.4]
MKTVFYMLVALFITVNLMSCTADNIADDQDISVETVATGDGEVTSAEDEG